jgi:hypothetical protein
VVTLTRNGKYLADAIVQALIGAAET